MRTEPEPKPKPESSGREESPEALLAEAKYLDSEIQRAVAGLRQTERDTVGMFAGAIGLPAESDRLHLIWEGLTRFVNKDLDRQPAAIEGSMVLRAVIALCVHDNSELGDIQKNAYDLGIFADVCDLQNRKKLSVDQAFAVVATELQPNFRRLLQWIADPNRMDRKGRRLALQFLIEHSEQELAQCNYDANDEFNDSGYIGAPFFFWKHSVGFQSIATPIARFIYERLARYHNSELKLHDAVPIVLCKGKVAARSPSFDARRSISAAHPAVPGIARGKSPLNMRNICGITALSN
jgi:hypothetical protein